MNFNKLRKYNALWNILRMPLSLIPDEQTLYILQGPVRGKKWIAGSLTHDCWIGCYENNKFSLFSRHLKKGDVVYDIGANVGIYTLLSSTLTGDKGEVHAFEPNPRNHIYLDKHIKINNLSNVTVNRIAISSIKGKCFFSIGENHSTSCLSDDGDYEVNTISLDEYVFIDKNPVPDIIKIDVEGAEYKVLTGAKKMLANNSPIIFLATHGSEVHKDCCLFLESLGYDVKLIEPREIIAIKNSNI